MEFAPGVQGPNWGAARGAGKRMADVWQTYGSSAPPGGAGRRRFRGTGPSFSRRASDGDALARPRAGAFRPASVRRARPGSQDRRGELFPSHPVPRRSVGAAPSPGGASPAPRAQRAAPGPTRGGLCAQRTAGRGAGEPPSPFSRGRGRARQGAGGRVGRVRWGVRRARDAKGGQATDACPECTWQGKAQVTGGRARVRDPGQWGGDREAGARLGRARGPHSSVSGPSSALMWKSRPLAARILSSISCATRGFDLR